MSRSFVALSAALLAFTGHAQAQDAHEVEDGAEIHATLSRDVVTRRAEPGDEIHARTTRDVFSNGRVVIPAGSRLVGRITHVWSAGKSKSREAKNKLAAALAAENRAKSELGFVFERAILKNGDELTLNAGLRALASPSATDAIPRGAKSDITADGFEASFGAGYGTLADGGRSRSARGGLESDGALVSGSKGVFGLKGLELTPTTIGNTEEWVVASGGRDLALPRGTHLLLVNRQSD